MKPIAVGTKVQWTSQSAGYTKLKQGKVVDSRDRAIADLGLGRKAECPIAIARDLFPGHRYMFDGDHWPNRRGVLVEVRDGKTERAKPKLYMPNPNSVEVIL